nr:hypothetical protein [Pyrinomonadaceae bacterium]
FNVTNLNELENFLMRISKLYNNEVTVALDNEGFYFCDNLTNRSIASDIFYRLIQEASSYNGEIIIDEL